MFIVSNYNEAGVYHVATERTFYSERTRKPHTYLVTRCSGRKLGGPWGQSTAPSGDTFAAEHACERCLRIQTNDRKRFQQKARRGFQSTLLAFSLRGEAYLVSGYYDRNSAANATRAIAREEGRAL